MPAGRRPRRSAPLFFWALVELCRDRKDNRRERRSARQGCKLLMKRLDGSVGRTLSAENIRDYHKKMEGRIDKTDAETILAWARKRREVYGWDANPLLYVLTEETLAANGAEVIHSEANFPPTK